MRHATAFETITKVKLIGDDLERLMLDWNAAMQLTQGSRLSPMYLWGKLEGLLLPCKAIQTQMEHYKREEIRGGPDYNYEYLVAVCRVC